MNEYLPYAGTNAIQEAVIGVHFRNNFLLPDVERARTAAEANLKDAFPRSENIHEAQVTIENSNQDFVRIEGGGASRLSGFQLSRIGADGKPSRVLRMATNLLTVHFMKYDRWDPTLADTLRYIETILPRLSLERNALQAFSLRYIDRFTFDGSPNDAKAGLLIDDTSSYVSKKCFDSGPFWHCNSGWFEIFGDNSRVLSQLNLGSAMVDNAPTVTIDHNMIWQMKRLHNTVESFFESAGGENLGLKAALNHLHDMNGSVLTDILLRDASQRIGLVS